MKRILCLLLALLLLAGTLTACSGGETDDWKYIRHKKTLLIGITEYSPFTYSENGGTAGFDADLARVVCQRLKLSAEFVPVEWERKEAALEDRTVDVIWTGLTVTPARRGSMDFSRPYLVNEQCVVVKADAASQYSGVSSFAGKKVAAAEGTAAASAVEYGMTDAVFLSVSTPANALRLVKNGEADGAVVDRSMADILTAEDRDYSDLRILGYIPLINEEYAVGFRKGSTAVEEFNKVLEELLADGTVAHLAGEYGLTPLVIE